ncbi:MAG TPA: polysaccharide biosynthesis tyrosine autokinase [Candidatus Binatia bacterium]|nr:polysaccharide biosynthesis tyrosine autokinase [Candidatus Binatia bacterium]
MVDADEERPRHLRDYLAVITRHRRLVATCFVATLVLTVLVTLVIPRRWSAATRVQISRQSPIQLRLQQNVLSLDDTDHTERGALAFLATQVSALKSRDLAERVIHRHALDQNPAFLDPGGDADATLPGVPAAVRPRGLDATIPIRPDNRVSTGPIDPKLLDRYLKWLTVRDVSGTDAIEISFVTPSPTLSAFLAAAHTQAYLDANADALKTTDSVARGFLEKKIAESKKRLKRAEEALDRFATQHPDVMVDQEHKVGGQRITELSTMLTQAETDRVSLESRYEFLNSPNADPLAYFLDRPGVEKLRLALLDVQAQKAGLDERLGENHPRMVELRRLESELSGQLRAEVNRGVSGVRSHYTAAKQREDRLRRKLEQQQEIGTELNRVGARYALLKNDVETARALNTSLLEQGMATAVNSDLTPTNVRVLEHAEVPEKPSRPKWPLNLALGAVAGLVFSIGAAFGRDYFDQSVKGPDDVTALIRVPTLATIPNFELARRLVADGSTNGAANGHSNGNGKADELVVLHEPASQVAEAFRSMRTALLFSSRRRPKVILVTSARPAEGKTVASLNLATTLAEGDARVLLVEADLRHPRCHRMLGIPCAPGLSTFLGGQNEDVDALVHPLDPPGLFFLPSGPVPRNPAELLGSQRMRVALRELRRRYDYVVVDTPPALPVTDAVILGRLADGVVLVVKGNATPRDLVRRAHDRLAQAGARFLGVVANNVTLAWGEPYFGDGYSYGYGYGARSDEPVDGDGPGPSGFAATLRHARDVAGNSTGRMRDVGTVWVREVMRFARGGRAG